MTGLSVICAFRDVAPFIPDLVRSLARTSLPADTELIFVDDGSSDGSADLVDEVARRHRLPVEIITSDQPAGPAYSRNLGMSASTGTHLAFVDGDDWVGPTYFAELGHWMDRLGVDFIRTDHVRVSGRHRTKTRAPDPRYNRRLDPSSAILPCDRGTMVDFPYSHSGVFHRRLLDRGLLEMPPMLRTAEDRPWIWRLHLEAESYGRIESLQYFYRRDVVTSLTQVGDDRQLDFIESFKQVLAYVHSQVAFERYRSKAYRQCLSVVHHHLLNAERLHPGLEQEMRSQMKPLLAMIPDDEMAMAFAAIGRDRADRIRDVDLRLHGL